MTDSIHSDWKLAYIEALESKIRELKDENLQLRNALEEIEKTKQGELKQMSIWTHIAGVVRLSDYNDDETSMFKIFKEGFDGNMPCGSEGSIHMFPIPKRLDCPTMRRQICFYGDLRDFGSNKVEVIKTWWSKIPKMLGNDRYIDQAIISIEPENGRRVVLTEEDMQC